MTNNMLSNSHAAAIFTAEKSPYISYISKIERAEAKVLERDLRAAAALIKKRNTANLRYPCAVVECRDIEYHAAGKDNNALTCTPLMDEGLAVPKPETVAHFLNHLGDCRSNIHTRIIVLLGDRTFADGQAADGLLFCHILGTMLDLSPVDVRFLAQLNTPTLYDAKKLQRPYELPMKPGFVSLGESTYGRSRGAAAYLGRRKLGNHSPHVVVIRLQECSYQHEHFPWASVGSLCEPPTYSQHMSGVQSFRESFSAGMLFARALRHGLWSRPPLRDDEMTGSWISALVYMDAIVRARSVEHLASLLPDASKTADTNELREVSMMANQTCAELQTSVNQVAAFSKSFPSVRQSDFHDAYHFLERLLGEANRMAHDIKETLDTQHQIKNFEVSSLAVHESKSAIALTVLAFIFIPINLASSVYGMNVQEINETGHSIWGFFVTALILLTCSGLAWVLWHAFKRGRLQALYRDLVDTLTPRQRVVDAYGC